MLDFLLISARATKKDGIEIYPKFIIKKSEDLMVRGGDFYAIWIEEEGRWSTDEQDALRLIDRELDEYVEKRKNDFEVKPRVLHMWDAESGMVDRWHKYCQKQLRDNFHTLDEELIFANTETSKTDYASKRLSYPLEAGDFSAYDKIISTLYLPDERRKIEWAIGSIVSGDSKRIQKFLVLYGMFGTGKSTVINIIQQLFEGYYSVFDAKALGSSSNAFALEAFKSNPLVAIQHDGDLSKIEDNTRLNSLVSHELMTVNEKFKSTYSSQFKCFLIMGTNKPVRITDAKSGLIRRLIDVTPSGNKLPRREYEDLMGKVKFELGAIATHCLEVYRSNPGIYDDYIPTAMLGASNDFYNFVLDSFHIFKEEDGVSLKSAWEMYKTYCDEAKVPYPYSQRVFKEELRNYFREYSDRFSLSDGSRVRSYFSGFRADKFDILSGKQKTDDKPPKSWIIFSDGPSKLDELCADCPAQYASEKETPLKKWDDVKTTLSGIDTHQLHYVRVPENHIVIDFDIPGDDGEKSLERNIEEASKWPKTYAELSKSGKGVHLHYIYSGDPTKLSRIYDEHIEVKVFTGKTSLRRKLTRCNGEPIATISSGLPLKGEKKMVDFDSIKSEKRLRLLIKRNLNKEIHDSTKCSVDFIHKLLTEAYESGLKYDVSDMRTAVLAFGAGSTHQADYCVKLIGKTPFKSAEQSESKEEDEAPLVFYDVEVFPNLFLVNWKAAGEGKSVARLINPKPSDIEELLHFRLVGFNCRRYDNHILYARLLGHTNEQLYNLSQRIIGGDREAFFGEAYNISYTDVYDFCSKKQSLKKWEIELGIHHKELGLPWDEPVPEELWPKVAEYCDNDVLATEAVFNARNADFVARQIQVDLVKLMYGINASVNDTTNTLSAKIIFGGNKSPQDQFNYRDLSKPVSPDRYKELRQRFGPDYIFRVWNSDGLPLYEDFDPKKTYPKGFSILPFFPGYTYEFGKSTYLGEEIGEGGRVYSEPGMYGSVWDGDVSSMHPHSVIFECLFGPKFTKIFKEIVDARVAIKHLDFDAAEKMLEGALKPYLNEEQAPMLAQALKIVINSIYGLTSAAFDNPFRDRRNKDNIVAKRGALFMTLLKREVQSRGFQVCHIKTDSIKIPNPTPEIIDFVCQFGKEYGYIFETEAEFDRFCLVNDAVYVARYSSGKNAGQWNATGAQFQVPYVFKKLFSHEEIDFYDLCETKSVSTALYLDMNESLPDVSEEERVADLRHSEKKLTKVEASLLDRYSDISDEELTERIEAGHSYVFVGRVGQFCPIKPGCGGGLLVRKSSEKSTYGHPLKVSSATGAKNRRWLESEMVKSLGKEGDIDRSYYDELVNKAVESISEHGDFEWFTASS